MSAPNLNLRNKTGIESFKTAWLKRRAQFSTVAFLKTSDPKRLPQFIRFIYTTYSASQKPFEIYVFKVWSGLFKVTVSEDGITYEPVAPATPVNPLMQALQQVGGQIRSLNQALEYLDNLMNTRERVIAIFWGLFSYKSVSDQEYYSFVKFLRNAIFTDEYYGKYHFIVVFTEAPETIADDDTLRHSIVVDVPPSTENERAEILRSIAEKLGLSLSNGELGSVVEALKGLNLHEVESVALESIFKYKKFDVQAMIEHKYDIIRKSGILDIEEQPAHGFEAVGGYDVLKWFIITRVVLPLRYPEFARRLGLRPPRGILLFGPPGTGKTWFARALAKELQLPFLRLRTEKIVSKWYGETTRNLAKAIQVAEEVAPCVMFIDEIDRFGRRGHPSEHEESRRAFSVLLEWLGDERRRTIIVGTTNKPEDLDEAFRRVGRFDYIIPVLYPDFKARVEILKVHTRIVRKVPLADDVDLTEIARRTEMWSGAELQELVVVAAARALIRYITENLGLSAAPSDYQRLLEALRSGELDAAIRRIAEKAVVTMRDFEEALATFRINADERRRQMEHYMRLAMEYTNDAEFLEILRKSCEAKDRLEALKSF